MNPPPIEVLTSADEAFVPVGRIQKWKTQHKWSTESGFQISVVKSNKACIGNIAGSHVTGEFFFIIVIVYN